MKLSGIKYTKFHTGSKLNFTDSGAAIFKELGLQQLATMAVPKN